MCACRLELKIHRPAMLRRAGIGLAALNGGDHRAAGEHSLDNRQAKALAPAGGNQAAGSLVKIAHLAEIQRIHHQLDRRMTRILLAGFPNYAFDFVVWVWEALDNKPYVVRAGEFLAKCPHQKLRSLPRKA